MVMYNDDVVVVAAAVGGVYAKTRVEITAVTL